MTARPVDPIDLFGQRHTLDPFLLMAALREREAAKRYASTGLGLISGNENVYAILLDPEHFLPGNVIDARGRFPVRTPRTPCDADDALPRTARLSGAHGERPGAPEFGPGPRSAAPPEPLGGRAHGTSARRTGPARTLPPQGPASKPSYSAKRFRWCAATVRAGPSCRRRTGRGAASSPAACTGRTCTCCPSWTTRWQHRPAQPVARQGVGVVSRNLRLVDTVRQVGCSVNWMCDRCTATRPPHRTAARPGSSRTSAVRSKASNSPWHRRSDR